MKKYVLPLFMFLAALFLTVTAAQCHLVKKKIRKHMSF